MNFGLSKDERISSVKAIEDLIARGHHVNLGVVRCCWTKREDGCTDCRMMVSVPKKLFKRAVKRNLLKRRIRESYRLQKHGLDGLGIDIMFVYNSKEVAPFQLIYEAVGTLMERVCKQAAKQ